MLCPGAQSKNARGRRQCWGGGGGRLFIGNIRFKAFGFLGYQGFWVRALMLVSCGFRV